MAWPARQWQDLDDLNAQAQAWCDGWTMDRPCPEERSISVRQAFEHDCMDAGGRATQEQLPRSNHNY